MHGRRPPDKAGRGAGPTGRSEDEAVVLLLAARASEKRGTSRVLEDLADALARPRRTLEVVTGADLLRDCHALRRLVSTMN
jgi:hypothetical protein